MYHSTPTVYRHFVRTLTGAERFPALRLVVMGGEAVYKADVELVQATFSCVLFVRQRAGADRVHAGAAIFSRQAYGGQHDMPYQSGYPVDGTEILVLDDAGEPVQGYGLGEIASAAPTSRLGYWRQPALTAAAFRPDPAGGK